MPCTHIKKTLSIHFHRHVYSSLFPNDNPNSPYSIHIYTYRVYYLSIDENIIIHIKVVDPKPCHMKIVCGVYIRVRQYHVWNKASEWEKEKKRGRTHSLAQIIHIERKCKCIIKITLIKAQWVHVTFLWSPSLFLSISYLCLVWIIYIYIYS